LTLKKGATVKSYNNIHPAF